MRQTKEHVLYDVLEEVSGLMEDLLQSGFDTVHDSTLEELERAVEVVKQYGMTYLSELLQQIKEQVTSRRHQSTRQQDKIVEQYAQVNEYLFLCRQKIIYDEAYRYYAEDERV